MATWQWLLDGVDITSMIIPRSIGGQLSGSPINGTIKVSLLPKGATFEPEQRQILEAKRDGTTVLKGPITNIKSTWVNQTNAVNKTEKWELWVDDMARQLTDSRIDPSTIVIRAGGTTVSGTNPISVADQVRATTGSETPLERLTWYVSTYLPGYTIVGSPTSTVTYTAPDFNMGFSGRSHWKNLVDIANFAGWAIRVYSDGRIRCWDPVNNPRSAPIEISDRTGQTLQNGAAEFTYSYEMTLEEDTTGLMNTMQVSYHGGEQFIFQHDSSVSTYGEIWGDPFVIDEVLTLPMANQLSKKILRDRALPIWTGSATIPFDADVEPGMEVWCHQVRHGRVKKTYIRGVSMEWAESDAHDPSRMTLDFGSEVWDWPGLPNPIPAAPEIGDYGPNDPPGGFRYPPEIVIGDPGGGDESIAEKVQAGIDAASGEWRIYPVIAAGSTGPTDPALVRSYATHNADGSTSPRAYSRYGLSGSDTQYTNTFARFTPDVAKWFSASSAWNLTAATVRRMARVAAPGITDPDDITDARLFLPIQDSTGDQTSTYDDMRTTRFGLITEGTLGGQIGSQTTADLWALGGSDRIPDGQQFEMDGSHDLHRIVARLPVEDFIVAVDGKVSIGILYNGTRVADETAGAAVNYDYSRVWIGYSATFDQAHAGPAFSGIVPAELSGHSNGLIWAGPSNPLVAYDPSDTTRSTPIALSGDPSKNPESGDDWYGKAWALIQTGGVVVADDEADRTCPLLTNWNNGASTFSLRPHQMGSLSVYLKRGSMGETEFRELAIGTEWTYVDALSLSAPQITLLDQNGNPLSLNKQSGQLSNIRGDTALPDQIRVCYVPETVNGGTGGGRILKM